MSPAAAAATLSKSNRIGCIVKLRQMIRRWRNKSRISAARTPPDVPAGHVAVCVGANGRRFVVRATYLNHPVFQKLLSQAEEEYGFSNQAGPLLIPCDESFFQEIIHFISRSDSRLFIINDKSKSTFHLAAGSKLRRLWLESQPLLPGVADKTVW